jgi:Schlafen, AlbA_2
MVTLRSRRLETQLGSRIETAAFEQVSDLVTNQVAEAFDLDFKSRLYGNADKDKRELAADVAALANTSGGLIVLGIEEDDQARAAKVTPVASSDAEQARMSQIIASLTAPMPEFAIQPVEDPANSGTGFLLVSVPRSPRQPHAVLVNEGLRYPRRNGSTTRYLAEAEVAAAYRDRFFSLGAQTDRADEVEHELLNRLLIGRLPWVVVSLVPDLAGDYVIDAAARRAFRGEMNMVDPHVVPRNLNWLRFSVGRRRLIADGTMRDGNEAEYLGTELHSDGSGAFASVVPNLNEGRVGISDEKEQLLDDESIALVIMSGLRFLARHARDRTAAGGEALVRVQLYPVGLEYPRLRLGHSRGFMSMGGTLGDQVITMPLPPMPQIVPLDESGWTTGFGTSPRSNGDS